MTAACDNSLHFSDIISSPTQLIDPSIEQHFEDVDQPELHSRTDSLDYEKHYIGNLLQESKEESFYSEVSTAGVNEKLKTVSKTQKKPSVQKKIRAPHREYTQVNGYDHVNSSYPELTPSQSNGQQLSEPSQYNGKTYSAVAQKPKIDQWNGVDGQLDFQRLFNKPGSPSSTSSSSHSSANSVNTFGGNWNAGQPVKAHHSQPNRCSSQLNLLANAGVETVPPKPVRIPGFNPVDERAGCPKLSNGPKMLGKKQRSVGDFQLQINNNNRKKKSPKITNNGLKDVTKHGSFSNFSSAFPATATKNISNTPSIHSKPTNVLKKRSESNNHLSITKLADSVEIGIQMIAPTRQSAKRQPKSRFEVLSSISRPDLNIFQKDQPQQRRSQSVNSALGDSKKAIKEKGKNTDKLAYPLIDLSIPVKPKNLRKDSLEDASLPTLTKNGLMLMLNNFILFLASAFGGAPSGRRCNNNYASVAAAGRRRINVKVSRKYASQTPPALKLLYITCLTLWKALQISGNWIADLFVNFFVLLFRAAADGCNIGFQNFQLMFYVCWLKIYSIGKKVASECLQLHREMSDQINHLCERAFRKLTLLEKVSEPRHPPAESSDINADLASKSSSKCSLVIGTESYEEFWKNFNAKLKPAKISDFDYTADRLIAQQKNTKQEFLVRCVSTIHDVHKTSYENEVRAFLASNSKFILPMSYHFYWLADLGVTRHVEKLQRVTSFHGTPGSVAYMAPEAINNALGYTNDEDADSDDEGSDHENASVGYTLAVDWYAVGILLLEMYTGESQYVADDLEDALVNAKYARDNGIILPEELSESTKNFLNRLLKRKDRERLGYESVEEVKNHPFFNNFNWEKLAIQKIQAPYLPYFNKKPIEYQKMGGFNEQADKINKPFDKETRKSIKNFHKIFDHEHEQHGEMKDFNIIKYLRENKYIVENVESKERFYLKERPFVNQDDWETFNNEIKINRAVDSKFFLPLHSFFWDMENYIGYLVFTLVPADLSTFIRHIHKDGLAHHSHHLNKDMIGSSVKRLPKGEVVDQNNPLDENELRFYAANIVIIVKYLQQREIVHRNLKPENFMIGDNGYLLLTDFAISRNLKKYHRTASNRGTFTHLAPEMLTARINTSAGYGQAVAILTGEVYMIKQ
uniref:Protein kinase domain-containing protein n=1 Tax=Ditylenchus dipsaci TaxID=166011 RepID=A0A915DPD2_9BILA